MCKLRPGAMVGELWEMSEVRHTSPPSSHVWNHIPETTCCLSFVCDFDVQDLLFRGSLAEAKPYVSADGGKKKIDWAISGIRRNMAEVKKININ